MRTIHKQILSNWEDDGSMALRMPVRAKIRVVQAHNGRLVVWYECNPENPPEDRFFVVRGTGHEFFEDIKQDYLGTVQVGPFVWHVYEVLT